MTTPTAPKAKLPRMFMYNSVELEDPGPEHDAVDVRNLYAATYPEILNAAIEGPEAKNGKMVYTFRRAVGTKGSGAVKIELVIAINPRGRVGLELIAAERLRQMNVKRWTAAHDDEHADHSLAMAACAYAAPELLFRRLDLAGGVQFLDCWPSSWAERWDKRPRHEGALIDAHGQTFDLRIRNLVKAGALIAAEIDRLTRLKGPRK